MNVISSDIEVNICAFHKTYKSFIYQNNKIRINKNKNYYFIRFIPQ